VKGSDTSKVDEQVKRNTVEDLFGGKTIKISGGKELPKSTIRTHLILPVVN
jgi:hypothetical protein